MLITNSAVYDKLKWLALVGLPALGSAYFALAGIWGLPSADQVVGTIVVADTFLGVLLGISTAQFSSANVGTIDVKELPSGGKTYSLELDGQPEMIEDKDEVRFKVIKGEKL